MPAWRGVTPHTTAQRLLQVSRVSSPSARASSRRREQLLPPSAPAGPFPPLAPTPSLATRRVHDDCIRALTAWGHPKRPTGGCPIGPDPTVLELLRRRRRRRPPPAPRLLHWVCSCGGGGGGSGGGHAEKQRVAHSLARPRCLRLRLIMTSVTAMPPRVVGLGHSRRYRGCSRQRRLR